MNLQQLLDKAIRIAEEAHAGQVDKGGNPYIDHPKRVMDKLDTLEEKIVGILHDTIEDTYVTAQYLLDEGFPQYIVDGILSVTKREDEKGEEGYFRAIERAKKHPLGRRPKYRDLEDNSNIDRIPPHLRETEEQKAKIAKRMAKYAKAMKMLEESF